jgi:hypothetical protein
VDIRKHAGNRTYYRISKAHECAWEETNLVDAGGRDAVGGGRRGWQE